MKWFLCVLVGSGGDLTAVCPGVDGSQALGFAREEFSGGDVRDQSCDELDGDQVTDVTTILGVWGENGVPFEEGDTPEEVHSRMCESGLSCVLLNSLLNDKGEAPEGE